MEKHIKSEVCSRVDIHNHPTKNFYRFIKIIIPMRFYSLFINLKSKTLNIKLDDW